MSERDVNSVPPATASDDVQGRPGTLPQWLIRHAARRAPPDLSDRLAEEWGADLAARSSALSRWRFAVGCCWATTIISREHGSARIPVANAAGGPKIILGGGGEAPGLFARRSLTFFLVAGLHVALFYGLMTGLAFRIIKEIPISLQSRPMQPPKERALPPLPPPALTKSRIEMSPPELPPTEPGGDNTEIVASLPKVEPSPPGMPVVLPPRAVTRVPGGPGSGFPTTDDYYPSIAKRLEEQGVSTVRVCVGANGRLTGDPTIAESSGSLRLDEGALLLAKAGSGHYRAATEDGRAVDSCYAFRVRFALRSGR